MYVEPQIREITIELLNIIRDTENDDLTSVMQKIVCTYTEQLTPVAKEMCKHLVDTFAQVNFGLHFYLTTFILGQKIRRSSC